MDFLSSDNVGTFYRYVNKKLGNTKTVHPTKIGTSKNGLTDNPVEQANIFNDYFSSVFTVNNGIKPQLQPRADNKTFCDSVLFTADDIRETYYRLNLAPLLVPMEYQMYFSRNLHTLFVILYVTFLIVASSRIASHLSGSKLLSPLFSEKNYI